MGGMKELAAMRRRQAEFFNEELGQSARKPGSNEGASGDEDLYPDPKRVQEEEEEEEKEEEVWRPDSNGIIFALC